MNMQCNKYDEAYMHDAMIVRGDLQGTWLNFDQGRITQS